MIALHFKCTEEVVRCAFHSVSESLRTAAIVSKNIGLIPYEDAVKENSEFSKKFFCKRSRAESRALNAVRSRSNETVPQQPPHMNSLE